VPPDATAAPGRARFSVVIPAHDEATVLGRCLAAFTPDLEPGEAEVIVVANGCSDDTADRARSVGGVQVLELAGASKVGALNAGDAACTVFPRVYLDADITVSAATLRAVARALPSGRPAVASAVLDVALDGRPWAVRSFYRAFGQLPYARDRLVGLGLYALSDAGRARFGAFPDVIADDLFVSSLFGPGERTVVEEGSFTVQAPRDLGSLLRVRIRVAAGNAELTRRAGAEGAHSSQAGADSAPSRPTGATWATGATAGSTGSTVRSLASMCSDLRRVPDVATYVLVTALARWRARRPAAGTWLTDRSTR